MTDTVGPTITPIDIAPTVVRPGTEVSIAASVQDGGQGVDASSVVARIEQPDRSTVLSLGMTDPDGDGTFTAVWQTAGFASGAYCVDIVGSDLAGNPSEAESVGTVVINSAPTIAVSAPDADAVVHAGETVMLFFAANDPDSTATISLFLDTDKISDTGLIAIASGQLLDESTTQLVLDGGAYPLEAYWVYAVVADEYGQTGQWSNGRVVIENAAPHDIALAPNTVAENLDSGTVVGSFTTADADAGDSHAYELVPGIGADDNGFFVIQGETLKTAAAFDYEAKSNYEIRVRATDGGGKTCEQPFTVTVRNVNEASPSVDLDLTQPGSEFKCIYRLGGEPSGICRPAASEVCDPDSEFLAWATVSLASPPNGPHEQLSAGSSSRGITTHYNSATGVLLLHGTAPVSEYAELLNSVRYSNTAQLPDDADRQVAVVVSDGEFESATAVCSIFLADDAIAFTLHHGWNLIAFPFDIVPWTPICEVFCDASAQSLIAGTAWRWETDESRYVSITAGAEESQGIWVYSPIQAQRAATTTMAIPGRIQDGMLQLTPGWNLIGPVVDIPVGMICASSAVAGTVQYWDEVLGCYQDVAEGDVLLRGRGYWVYAQENVELDLLP